MLFTMLSSTALTHHATQKLRSCDSLTTPTTTSSNLNLLVTDTKVTVLEDEQSEFQK